MLSKQADLYEPAKMKEEIIMAIKIKATSK
jgi:hypothetical protein